ncbi:MAG: coproporphyrinogen dehydrogenase HemZ [Eubacteriales bacterium]|nr:coproporphyrinogen dehydrogenase HemZ [Eubacteriales bacterium]
MIALLLDETLAKYEQDIREILMAFFPGEKFCYEKKPEAGLFVCADAVHMELIPKETAACPATNDTCSGSCGQYHAPVSLTDSRRENKTRVKQALYSLLHALTGETLPWGTLTGIRPVKLAEGMLSGGLSDEETEKRLQDIYYISEEKRKLMLSIAHREREVLHRIDYRSGMSLYIGIPFCPTTCMYCSFTSYPIAKWENRIGEYLGCLREELRQLRTAQQDPESALYGKALQTIYIGGGTPTSISAEALSELLGIVEETMDLSALAEYTVEAGRPDSITPEKLRVLKAHGIGRISINPQTMNQKTLDLIGRRHSVEDVKRAFFEAREAGFDNINMDLILGLPEESVEDVRHTLSEIERMRPDSLTVHALAVKRAARLNTEGNAWAHLARAGKEEAAEMGALSQETARNLGLEPYYLYRQKNMAGNQENVGYAEPGKENLYNILMMEEKHTVIGCGAGSSSKLVVANDDAALHDGNAFWVERFENIKNISEYLPRFGELMTKKSSFLSEETK